MPDRARFRKDVSDAVHRIPRGRVMTYGQIAALAGRPRGARAVGFIAHYGDPGLPWHRVVNRHGRVAPGYPGGMPAQADELRAEGIEVDADWRCDVDRYRWWPDLG